LSVLILHQFGNEGQKKKNQQTQTKIYKKLTFSTTSKDYTTCEATSLSSMWDELTP